MPKCENGLHQLSREDYDRSDRVNWSTLKHLGKSPAHYRHHLMERDLDTDARKRGRAVHLAVFEPERFRAECVVYEGKVRRGKEWEAFVDKHPDDEILTEDMYEKALTIGKAARACAMAAPYLSGGKGELSMLWTHVLPPSGGLDGYKIDCKGRIDFLANSGAIVDLKNTRDASLEGFGRQCANYETHVQAAFYVDGYKAITGIELPYVLVAVEPSAPFVTQVFVLPSEIIALGRERYRTLLDRLNVCRQESDWPGYATAPVPLTLPRWAVPHDEEDVTGLDLVIG